MKKEKFIYALGALFCLSTKISAQDTLKNKQLNEVVITASRTEKNIADVGRSISVITAADIQVSGVNSIEELLSQQAGMYIVGTGQNPGMTGSIFTRGSNSNQTLILIDGVRITDPSAINNSIDVSELSLANIERIEIVRGSHSTLYGSSAIGGVINIITKNANKPGLTADISITAGTFGKSLSNPSYGKGDREQTGKATKDLSENLYLNYALKNGIYVGAELSNVNVNGMDATVDTVTNTSVYKQKDMSDGFDKIDWIGKAGYHSEKFDVYTSYKQTHQKTDIDKSAYKDDDNYILDFKRNLLTYGASCNLNKKFNIAYIGGLSQMKRIVIDDSSTINSVGTFDKTFNKGVYEGSNLSNELQMSFFMKGLNIVLGGGLYSEKMNVNTSYYYYNQWGFPPAYEEIKTSLDSVNPSASTLSIFLHTDIGAELISEKLNWFTLSGGLRLSNYGPSKTNITYEVNPSIKVGEGGLLYTTFATGYNVPSLYQSYDPTGYVTWDTQFSTGLTRGNKKLNPESSKTFEFGFKQTFNNIKLSAAYFNTQVNDVIEYVYLWDKNIGIDTLGQNFGRDDFRGDTYLNLGTMYSEGVELGISSKISEKFVVSGNVSLLSGKIIHTPTNIDTVQTGGNHVQVYSNGTFMNEEVKTLGLVRRPNTANLSLTYWTTEKISIRADVRYAGARGDVYYESKLGPYGALGTVAVEQYTLLDLSFAAKLYEGFSALIKVNNVLDKKYSEINGFTTRGRGFYFTLRFSL